LSPSPEIDPAGTGRLVPFSPDPSHATTRFLLPKSSVRAIVRYQRLNANPSLSSLTGQRDVNVDLLFTYLVQPGTALYVGLNADRQAMLSVDRGRQIFVKMSYLLPI
jgi:hypothetical protein